MNTRILTRIAALVAAIADLSSALSAPLGAEELATASACCLGGDAPNAPLKKREEVRYYDRNGDGKADLETHHYPGMVDADWELRDDDFSGRFEKKVLYGIAIVESRVDIPVPMNVSLEKRLPKQWRWRAAG